MCKKTYVYFIDTGYLFQETLDYKEELEKRLGLHFITLSPEARDHNLILRDKTWAADPDLCCRINKVSPLEKIKSNFEIWMTGLVNFQTSFRQGLQDLKPEFPLNSIPLSMFPVKTSGNTFLPITSRSIPWSAGDMDLSVAPISRSPAMTGQEDGSGFKRLSAAFIFPGTGNGMMSLLPEGRKSNLLFLN